MYNKSISTNAQDVLVVMLLKIPVLYVYVYRFRVLYVCMYVCTIALLALRWALPDPSLR
jgi:hypothetical protein